ncbi:MAG: endonuclease domain-containing protein [Deltaproteobacteria bacterium]|nr:endonuclease domain-containing protein [Deltaproteobacteria bacterium]
MRGNRLGAKFRRQHPLKGFVVDFFCAQHRLVVEIDGAVHVGREGHDAARSEALVSAGFRVIRFTNDDVLHHSEDVRSRLESTLSSPPPTPVPLVWGAGG